LIIGQFCSMRGHKRRCLWWHTYGGTVQKVVKQGICDIRQLHQFIVNLTNSNANITIYPNYSQSSYLLFCSCQEMSIICLWWYYCWRLFSRKKRCRRGLCRFGNSLILMSIYRLLLKHDYQWSEFIRYFGYSVYSRMLKWWIKRYNASAYLVNGETADTGKVYVVYSPGVEFNRDLMQSLQTWLWMVMETEVILVFSRNRDINKDGYMDLIMGHLMWLFTQ